MFSEDHGQRASLPPGSRYQLLTRIASGGMGSVYLGTQQGAAGFRRVVALKRAFPHLLEDPSFRRLLVSEARVASLVRHPHAVSICDVEEVGGELMLVMDYVEGASLAELSKEDVTIRAAVGMRIVLDAAEGLHAVHTCVDEAMLPLGLVHRDVSPQNILVGLDGVARIADFGIAQITNGSSPTGSGLLRGKPSYMAPEYIASGVATPASDIFALGIVTWEALTQQRLFRGATDVDTLERVRAGDVPAPSTIAPEVSAAVDAVVLRALARSPDDRWPSARAFGDALTAALGTSLVASRADVGALVRHAVGDVLLTRRALLQDRGTVTVAPSPTPSPPHLRASSRPSSVTEIPVVTASLAPRLGDSIASSAVVRANLPGHEGSPLRAALASGAVLALLTAAATLAARNASPAAASFASPPVETAIAPTTPPPVVAPEAPPFLVSDELALVVPAASIAGAASASASAPSDTPSLVASTSPPPSAARPPAPSSALRPSAAPRPTLLTSPPQSAPANPYDR